MLTCAHCHGKFTNRQSRYCSQECWVAANVGKLHMQRNGEILRLWARGSFSVEMLAARYGMSIGSVYRIVRKAQANAKA